MKALVSPNEKAYSYDGTELGQRIVQVCDQEFPVATPLFFVDCSEECVADQWYYSNGQVIEKPVQP